MEKQQFDVALSFAGEQRDYVRIVAKILQDSGVKVFFDEFEQVQMWGEDLVVFFHQVFSKNSNFCVIFVSEEYARKAWPTHEKQSALEKAINQTDAYILPARFDDTSIPGLPSTKGYVDIESMPPEEFANLVIEKIGTRGSDEGVNAAPQIRLPKPSKPNLNPYEEVELFLNQLRSELESRSAVLEASGASLSTFNRGERLCVRVVMDNETVYSFDAWRGGMSRDTGVSSYGVQGEIRGGTGAMSATAQIVWSSESEKPALDLNDFSLFSMLPGGSTVLTYSQFIEKLWNQIVDSIERRG